MSATTVDEKHLLAMLAKRSGLEQDELFTTVYDARRRPGPSWPLGREQAEHLLERMLAELRAVLPSPAAQTVAPLPRYTCLSEFTSHYERCDTRRVLERIQYAGLTPAIREPGLDYDPHDQPSWDEVDGVRDEAWWRRVRQAGVRPCYRMPDPWVGRGEPPVDDALEVRAATGDEHRYEVLLHEAVERDPRQIDCWAHLGHLHLERASRGGRAVTSRLRQALGYYQAAVAIGELSLPAGFHGVLSWGETNNRPFHRALHGLGLAYWRLGEFEAAAAVQDNSLLTNPDDQQGISSMIDQVRARVPWSTARD